MKTKKCDKRVFFLLCVLIGYGVRKWACGGGCRLSNKRNCVTCAVRRVYDIVTVGPL